ncbi:serine hydrolase [Micromonospora sp. M71_S20]|uniref:serine hydrolase domain-containing protein n=1 Tax=Micromonospora sp. M71_S20 TaxID=592872 RepID=UPI0013157F4F|nr:serine hydrolase domain-containing protein [Micromonospora sp. M71_S20]
MGCDTIVRLRSMTKPIVAACAMTLVEDCTLRLDDPVDDLLPELADMRVLADPCGSLDDTVPAVRPLTLRDLLTFGIGIGTVLAEPGTVPIADALIAIDRTDLDEWVRRLGELPLVHQPGERWMYGSAADATGALIARATGRSLEEAVRERICEPLGMKDRLQRGEWKSRPARDVVHQGQRSHRRGVRRRPAGRAVQPAGDVRVRRCWPRLDR